MRLTDEQREQILNFVKKCHQCPTCKGGDFKVHRDTINVLGYFPDNLPIAILMCNRKECTGIVACSTAILNDAGDKDR